MLKKINKLNNQYYMFFEILADNRPYMPARFIRRVEKSLLKRYVRDYRLLTFDDYHNFKLQKQAMLDNRKPILRNKKSILQFFISLFTARKVAKDNVADFQPASQGTESNKNS